ncbi:MAG: hypothetical protein PHE20_03255 [Patescibacteria group bacterium]|jgi:hypothetical protein|nr:hypothetical protein [Patescibacteria group bacterium]
MSENFYKIPVTEDDLNQGDIFESIPFVQLDSKIVTQMVETENDLKTMDISSHVPDEDQKTDLVVASIMWKPGIVISQNCDATREEYISFCEIRRLEDTDKDYAQIAHKSVERKIEYLSKKEYQHQFKYFYLLQDQGVFDGNKMAVDFRRIYQVKKEIIDALKNKRIARLTDKSLDHFRSKLGNYFKRFAYDGWYVLNKGEYDIFYDNARKKLNDHELSFIKPYPWHI